MRIEMRILNVICLGFIFFITLLAVLCDYRIPKDQDSVSEVVQFSRDQFTGKSARITNEANFRPVIGARRRRRESAVASGAEATATKGREGKRKNKRERYRRRERERDRNPERYRDGKKEGKRGPLTRHARRQHKDAGANRTRSRQRGHERRNLEKQYLVRNRTLELLDKKTRESANRSPFIKARDVLFERRITPEKIGQILGDADRRTANIRITDLLIPKTFLEPEAEKNRVEIKPDDFESAIEKSRSNHSKTRDKNPETIIGSADPPLFLGKFKSIGMNVSRINKAVENLKESKSEAEISGLTDYEESNYRYDYDDVFDDPSVSPWVNRPQSREADHGREDEEYFLDGALLSSVYMPIDDQIILRQGLATLLSRMLLTLRNTTDEDNRELLQDLDFDDSVQEDLCQKWLDCKEKLEEAFLGPLVLPACPCHYPSSIFYDDKIWDEGQERHFRWRDVSGEAERLDVYKPGATYCIRSLLAQGGGSAAAQHCCYDGRRRLLTRGSGAGTPNLVSPEVSAVLHERIDILPWRLCKGDFSRFNRVRPPNNDNHCKGNPDEDEYQRQIDTTKHY